MREPTVCFLLHVLTCFIVILSSFRLLYRSGLLVERRKYMKIFRASHETVLWGKTCHMTTDHSSSNVIGHTLNILGNIILTHTIALSGLGIKRICYHSFSIVSAAFRYIPKTLLHKQTMIGQQTDHLFF